MLIDESTKTIRKFIYNKNNNTHRESRAVVYDIPCLDFNFKNKWMKRNLKNEFMNVLGI